MTSLEVYERSLGALLASLVARTPGVAHAVLTSIDGIALAVSPGLPTVRAEQAAGIGAGLLSIADGAGGCMSTGRAVQVLVEMAEGVLLAMPVTDQVCLTLLAAETSDRDRLGYEVGAFTQQVSPLLTAFH